MTNIPFRRRVNLLNWLLPISLIIPALLYGLSLAFGLQSNTPFTNQNTLVVLIYGLMSPLLVYLVLRQIGLWLDEEERNGSQDDAGTERMVQIATTSSDAILTLDNLGHIDTWNTGAQRLFGYEASIAVGHPFSDLLGGGSAADLESQWLYGEARRTGSVGRHETTCLEAGGRPIDVELTATLLKDGNDNPAGMSIIMRDITRRKQREEETRRLNEGLKKQATEQNRELAEKVQELGLANVELKKLDQTRSEFVSMVSHQIRAPLTNMGGAVQRMHSDCIVNDPTCDRMINIFAQQINRLDRLVQDVLNASRLESGEISLQLEPISVIPVVRQARNEIRIHTPGRLIRLEEKPGLPFAYADRDRVVEVVTNLLDNADKYSPPEKEVTIRVRADQTEVTVAVHDAGPGIQPEDLERIFDKFYRTDSSDAQVAYGYGLGLYVCQQLVAAQGGRIWAENHPEGGAVFSFSLPVWQENHDRG